MPTIQASSSAAQVFELQPVRQNTSNSARDNDCVICFNAMVGQPMTASAVGKARLSDINSDSVVETACKHHFHAVCISTWGMQGSADVRGKCPTCREPNDKLLSNLAKVGIYVQPIAHPEQIMVRIAGKQRPIPLTRMYSDLEAVARRGSFESRIFDIEAQAPAAQGQSSRQVNMSPKRIIITAGLLGVTGFFGFACYNTNEAFKK